MVRSWVVWSAMMMLVVGGGGGGGEEGRGEGRIGFGIGFGFGLFSFSGWMMDFWFDGELLGCEGRRTRTGAGAGGMSPVCATMVSRLSHMSFKAVSGPSWKMSMGASFWSRRLDSSSSLSSSSRVKPDAWSASALLLVDSGVRGGGLVIAERCPAEAGRNGSDIVLVHIELMANDNSSLVLEAV